MGATVDKDVITLLEVSKEFHLGMFRKKLAVDALSLSVPRGGIVGLLGPNGSGKSTTLKMILGFLRPTKGEILIEGVSATERNARKNVGYLPENPRFQKFMTGEQILLYYGRLLQLDARTLGKRIPDLLFRVGLGHAGKERVQGYSKGMTQRLAIAQALLNQPSLLIFDEPMSGLDPLGRMEIRQLIRGIHEDFPSSTIFFSTHILADAEELCEHVAVLRKGKLHTHCPIGELLRSDRESYCVVTPDKVQLPKGLTAQPSASGFQITLEGTDRLTDLLSDLKRQGARVISVETRRIKLEEALFADHPSVRPQEVSA